jgi:hypothetical protein
LLYLVIKRNSLKGRNCDSFGRISRRGEKWVEEEEEEDRWGLLTLNSRLPYISTPL